MSFSTGYIDGDRVSGYVLRRRLESTVDAEAWSATVQLPRMPPLPVRLTASRAARSAPLRLDRFRDRDIVWTVEPDAAASFPAPERETPAPADVEPREEVDRTPAADLLPSLPALALTRAREGRLTEALELADELLASADDDIGAFVVGRLQRMRARVLERRGDHPAARAAAEAALRCFEEVDDAPRQCAAMSTLAVIAASAGDVRGAERLYRDAITRARAVEARKVEADLLGNYAILLKDLGRYVEARRVFDADLAILRELQDAQTEAVVLGNLAGTLAEEGHLEAALTRYEEVVARHHASGRHVSEAIALGSLGEVLLDLGRDNEARTALERSLAMQLEAGNRASEAYVRIRIAWLEERAGRVDLAREQIEAVMGLGSAAPASHRARARWEIGRARLLAGEPPDVVVPDMDRAVADLAASGRRVDALLCAIRTAQLERAGGRHGQALARALALKRDIEAWWRRRGTARTWLELPRLLLDLGRPVDAREVVGGLRDVGQADERVVRACLLAEAEADLDDLGAAHRWLARAEAAERAEARLDEGASAALARARDLLDHATPARCLGRYRLLRLLGEGGQGRVWEAVAVDPRRVVALKELPHGQAMVREARLGGLLRHRHLVDVYEVGQDDGTWFCAMALCDGGTLTSHLPLPPRAVVEVGLQVCEALQYAHEAIGLVHLDLKPDNLLLHGGQVRVADLGIARVAEDAGKPRIRGTWRYMAPEQLAGGEVDARTDVYALGVVLHELATGAAPESSHTWAFDERPGAARADHLPDWLVDVVTRCTADEPDDRYASMGELARALRPLAVDGAGLAEAVGARSRPTDPPAVTVGRDRELELGLRHLLEGPSLVLRGPMGVGKTHLALDLARRYERATGERVLGPDAPADEVRIGQPLVVVDGAGADGARLAADLLAINPRARVLITTRQALDLAGASALEVTPLSPEDGVALVVDRARARGVELGDDPAISALVRRLGGLPLALELAAGRLGVLQPAEVLERLDLSMLRDETGDLESALTLALAELDPVSRVAIEQLSVLSESFGLAEAAEVLDVPGAEVIPVLTGLLHTSLLASLGDRLLLPRVVALSLAG